MFSNMFPFGKGEPYMEVESSYYDRFDSVKICSLMINSSAIKEKRSIPSYIEVIPVKFTSKFVYALWGIISLSDPNIYSEIRKVIIDKKIQIKKLYSIFTFFSRSHFEAHILYKRLKNNINDRTVFYVYRFEYQPYVALLLKKRLKKNIPIVCRAHRYDLYEEYNQRGYIPLREYILERIHTVYTCSEDGEQYLRRKYPDYSNKINTNYLGTVDYGIGPTPFDSNKSIKILSCSYAVKIKRLDRIYKVLSLVKGVRVQWIHYGDGPILEELKKYISVSKGGVLVEFRGSIDNRELMEVYKREAFDAFINLSDSEGLPVSIMEAMSFGVPCIATNVGGSGEIVKNGYNGLLLSPDVEEMSMAVQIENNLRNLADFRINARKTWESKFNASTNYSNFMESLYDLI